MRGVSEAEEDGRTGEDVGIKSGVELRCGGDEGAPCWDDMVAELERRKGELMLAVRWWGARVAPIAAEKGTRPLT